jgi:hypothetical protein
VIHQGHFFNLVYEARLLPQSEKPFGETVRVWVSRMTKADDAEMNHAVEIEVVGSHTIIGEYDGDDPPETIVGSDGQFYTPEDLGLAVLSVTD